MLPGISAGAMAVLDYVASTQACHPWVRVSEIAPAVRLSQKTVYRGRLALLQYGLIIEGGSDCKPEIRATMTGRKVIDAFMRSEVTR